MPLLPSELVDYILQYLCDSPSDLRACALVCKAWVAPSRAHLFYKIEVNYDRDPTSARPYQVIQQTPSLAVYVRELEVEYECITREAQETVVELLPLFTRLRKLVLSYIEWTDLERKGYHPVLALPTLTHLELTDVILEKREDFEDLIHPHLKWLTAHHVTWWDGDIVPQSVVNEEIQLNGRQPCHLRCLSVKPRRAFVDWLLGPQTIIDITSLRIFIAYGVYFVNMGDVLRMLQALRSLEHLRMRIIGGSFYLPFCQLILYKLYDRF
jgi:hypothetical protein